MWRTSDIWTSVPVALIQYAGCNVCNCAHYWSNSTSYDAIASSPYFTDKPNFNGTFDWCAITGPIFALSTHCPVPTVYAPAVYTPHRTAHAVGHSVTYNCPAGYHISGSKVLTCLSNQNWNGQAPTCVPGKLL